MFRNKANDKKKTLLAQKEKLLQEIQYYESKIDEFSNKSSNVYFGADSSDSEDGFPTYLDIGPSISELKRQDRLLKTCLQATQELTSVTVLESEVQVLIKDPDIGSEKPVSERGIWREVTAECRIDLVPFTILFYVHQPIRSISGSCYRGVRVSPVKRSQEVELTDSLLHSLTTPADVLETIRSYAIAYRSRRGTLARLADRYANTLFMLPREEGGFVLKCGSVMQMSWKLENNISPLAPFQHKMNFELEYMDESFLKIIKQSHRQLSDPSLQTDERTQILSKIISTCIEAQGLESDTESKKLEKTTLDDDDDDDLNGEETDKEIMAPPKSIPKRPKPKGKENNDGNRKSVKRNAEAIDVSVKKARTVDVTDSNDEIVNINTGLDENSDINNIKTSQDQEKKLSRNKIGKSDIKKKKNEEKSQDKLKSDKINEVNKNIKSDKVNVIEQSKTKETVNSKNLNNIDGPSKTQTQTDVSKISETVPTKTAKEFKKTGNSNDNKVINSKTSKSKKTGTFETINKNTNSDSNIKKIASETDKTDNHEPTNKKPNSSNVKKTNSTNAKVSSNSKPKKITKPNNATKTNDNANGKQTLNPETNNVKPVNAKKTINTGNAMKAAASLESANTKNIDEITIQKARTDHNNAKTSVNTAKTTKIGVIKSANAKINTKNGDSESTNAKINTKNGDTKSGNAKTNTKNGDSESTNAKINPKSGDTKSGNAKINTKNGDSESTNAKINPKSGDTKSGNAKINTKNGDSESTNAKINTKNGASKSVNAKIVIPETVNVNKSVNSDHATVKQTENTESNKMNSKKNTNLGKDVTKKLTNAPQNNSKISKDIKSKMVVRNHRNSSGKVKKSLKPSIGKESKIPQKKLSPAYGAVLKQNPVRISPRMLSKFKSPSDSNLQSKLFKPVTNIPRLLKKPAPKSK